MLKVFITLKDYPGIFDLPHDVTDVNEYFLKAGFITPYDEIHLTEDYNPDYHVKLLAETASDLYLKSIFPQDEMISTINVVCGFLYNLPAEKQADLTNKIVSGEITDAKNLLDAIKVIKAAETHGLPAIVFSRVKLWTDTGEECEFYMGGVPKDNDDFDENEDFKDFVEELSTGDTKNITAYITTFSEGEGECIPADKVDIERIYNAIADVDIDTISGWNKIAESQFSFDYDINELFNMNGVE